MKKVILFIILLLAFVKNVSGQITGTTNLCSNTTYTYIATPVTGATSYNWTLPTGWTSNGSTTNTIIVTTGSNSGVLSVSANNNAGNTITQNLGTTVINNNVTVAGPTLVCAGSTNSYVITPANSFFSNYNYSTGPNGVTPNGTVFSYLAPNSFNLTVAASGILYLTGLNRCVVSNVLPINVITPQNNLSISGNTLVCPNSTNTYTAGTVTGATSYTWSIPGGWSGTSTTNTIAVTTNNNAGIINVIANNICGTVSQTLAVNIFTTQNNLSISGNTLVCPNSTNTYTAGIVAGANSYTWSIPGAWSGTSTTNTIAITTNSNAGVINVTANNNCGSVSQSLTVNVYTTQNNLNIIGNSLVCNGLNYTYVAGVVTGATFYNWTIPSGWTINYSSSNTINITAAPNSGVVSVSAVNVCGNTIQTLSVTSTSIQTNLSIAGNTLACYGIPNSFTASPVNGASSYLWALPPGWPTPSTTNIFSTSLPGSAGVISVSAVNNCGATVIQTLAVNGFTTVNSSSIIGPTLVCPGTMNSYTTNPVNGVISYSWSNVNGYPSGIGTTTLMNFVAPSNASIQTLYLQTTNICGITQSAALQVTVSVPQTALTIAGNTLACYGIPNSFTASPVTGASSYVWTLPPGWPTPPTTNIFSTSLPGSSGIISVSALNNCGTTVTQTLAITGFTTIYTSSITGPTLVCPGSVNAYTAGVVNGVTSYSWANLTGSLGGSSTTTLINITAPSNASIQNLYVQTTNVCGVIQNAILPVYIIAPQTSLTISGSTLVCPNTTNNYTAGIVTGATAYTWYLPSGWSGVSSTNVIPITVNLSSGTITVKAVSNCGLVITQTLAVTVKLPQTNLGISGSTLTCPGYQISYTATPIVGAAPNSYTWSFPGAWVGSSNSNVITFTTGLANTIISVSAFNGCSIVTQTLMIGQNPTCCPPNLLPIPLTAFGSTICTNAGVSCTTLSVTSTLPAQINYTWMPANLNGATIAVCPTVTTTYTVYASSAAGCPSSATAAVVVTSLCCTQPSVSLTALNGINSSTLSNTAFLLSGIINVTGLSQLQNCEIWALPGAGIDILPGAVLDIDHVHMFACGINMWRGIVVQDGGRISTDYKFIRQNNSLIEDALVAIDLDNISPTTQANAQAGVPPIEIQRVIFNRNFIGIKISNSDPLLTDLPLGISGCVFTSRNLPYTTWPIPMNPGSWASAEMSPNTLPGNNPGMRVPSSITATAGLIPPYNLNFFSLANLKLPFASQPGHIGIKIDNVGNSGGPLVTGGVEIGLTYPGFISDDFNLFDGIGHGVDVTDASLTLADNVFQNMQYYTYPAGAATFFGGNGIYSRVSGLMNAQLNLSKRNISTWSVGNRFWNCINGTKIENVFDFKANHCIYRSDHLVTTAGLNNISGDYGILCNTNRFNYRVDSSEFNNLKYGIVFNTPVTPGSYNMNNGLGLVNSGVYAEDLIINYNYFGAEPTSATPYTGGGANTSEYMGEAIQINASQPTGWISSTQNSAIRSNKIDRAFRGVRVQNTKQFPLAVAGNSINIEDDFTFGGQGGNFGYGISLQNTIDNLTVESNTLNGVNYQNNYVSLFYADDNGCTNLSTPSPIVHCNYTSNSNFAFHFKGNNAATRWSGNVMCSHFGGLALTNSAVIGQQGTAALPSDNFWDCQGGSFINHTWVSASNPALSPLYVHAPTPGYQPLINNNAVPLGPVYTVASPASIYTTPLHDPYAMDCFANYAYPPFPSWRTAAQNSIATNMRTYAFDEKTLTIYPNPTNGLLTIFCENKGEVLNISIFDLNGQILFNSISFHQANNQIDISHLSASVYIIEVKNEEGKFVRKKLLKTE
jgi:hypothetical protein